ncbi:MAG: glycerate kinase [Acidimicrobiia bacterium]|nr:MAG: glycerate kinase [Acidimicrobiia bacterium]
MIGAYEAAVAACDPEPAVSRAISFDDRGVTVGATRFEGAVPDDLVVVALGKAASAMVRGAVAKLGDLRGIAVSNHVESCPVPLYVGSHPVPTSDSLAAGERLLDFVAGLEATDIVLYLISGGGSSIAVAPREGLTVADLSGLNDVLLRSGMPIGEMNEIRAAVSRIKGGRLADASGAARSVTLVVSDVVGVGDSHVASGPSLGAGMGADARSIVGKYELESLVSPAVVNALTSARPLSPDTTGPFTVIGSSQLAADASARYLEEHGFSTRIVTTALSGEARTRAVEMVRAAIPGTVSIATGETTVVVTGSGRGGRNQEAALAAAIEISGTATVFGALGTDGIDGDTPAAGAVVDGTTSAAAIAAGIDLSGSLDNNDSFTALSDLGVHVTRGDTGTNVGDLWMVG